MTEQDDVATSRRPRVFVMDMNAFDYSPAEAFGELVVLRAPPFAPGALDAGWNADVIRQLRLQLLEYTPMVDYLIPTGKPLVMCVVSMLAAERGFGRHQFLAWDGKYYRYVPYTIDLFKR